MDRKERQEMVREGWRYILESAVAACRAQLTLELV